MNRELLYKKLEVKYDCVHSFNEGFARVELNGKNGFVNEEGIEIIPLKYDYVADFHNGFAKIKMSKKWGFINCHGKEILTPKYDYVYNFNSGFACVELNDKCGIVNEQGEEIVAPKYDYIHEFCNGFAGVKLNDKWGFVSEQGEEIVYPKYDAVAVSGFKDGFAKVVICEGKINEPKSVYALIRERKNERYGIVNECGQEIISPKYFFIKRLNGYFVVALDDKNGKCKCGLFDKEGNEIMPAKYDDIKIINGGFAGMNNDGDSFFVNEQGEELVLTPKSLVQQMIEKNTEKLKVSSIEKSNTSEEKGSTLTDMSNEIDNKQDNLNYN